MKKTLYTISTVAVLSSIIAPSAFADSYTVKKGDSLHKIAQANKTTVAKIKELNKLESDAIYVNQVLLMDHTSTPTEVKTASQITFNKMNTTVHTVVSGDNLTKIANKYGITLGELKNLNSLTSTVIYPGDKLIVSETQGTTVVELPKTETSQPSKDQSHTVKTGDSLWKIASNNNTTVVNLKSINKLSSDQIYLGQVLQLEKSTETNSVTTPSVEATEQSVVKPTQPQNGSETYTVTAGDTLSKIASKYSMTINQLKAINNLTTDTIYLGQSLVIDSSLISSEASTTVKPDNVVNNTQSSSELIKIAKELTGSPYSWAGSSPSGFDCSGFIYYVLKKAGYQVSRVSSSTYFDMGKNVKAPQPGDLIFFDTTTNSKAIVSHMGIYLGNNEFIHASSSQGVTVTSINNSYFKNRIMGYKSL
ncbi:LysM peptidoglycan-binding domain-containing protein [Peribacillus loiseleuriae]|nr:peptidoglycan endopeptidase [Peribacillus loiseleuriae]